MNFPCNSYDASANLTAYCLGLKVVWCMAAQRTAPTTADLCETCLSLAFTSHQASAYRGQAENIILSVGLFCLLCCLASQLTQNPWEETRTVLASSIGWAGIIKPDQSFLCVTLGYPWLLPRPFSSKYLRSVITKSKMMLWEDAEPLTKTPGENNTEDPFWEEERRKKEAGTKKVVRQYTLCCQRMPGPIC